jgi:hypothetical protein
VAGPPPHSAPARPSHGPVGEQIADADAVLRDGQLSKATPRLQASFCDPTNGLRDRIRPPRQFQEDVRGFVPGFAEPSDSRRPREARAEDRHVTPGTSWRNGEECQRRRVSVRRQLQTAVTSIHSRTSAPLTVVASIVAAEKPVNASATPLAAATAVTTATQDEEREPGHGDVAEQRPSPGSS